MKNFAGKVAFVTGASSGIGLGIVRALAAEGMKVVLAARRMDRLLEAIAGLPLERRDAVYPIALDVTDRVSVQLAAEEAVRVFGKMHVLCTSAGVNLLGPMDRATADDWEWILSVNLMGVIHSVDAVLPLIKLHGEGGHILNVGSMSCFIAGPNSGLYTTSKFAVRGLSECLRYSLAKHKIGVSLLCPGLTQSQIYEAYRARPAHLAGTGFPVEEALRCRLAQIHSAGMGADEVGRIAVRGIAANQAFIFTHPEFNAELRELWEELYGLLPPGEGTPQREAVEDLRRKAKREAIAAVRQLD